MLLLWRTIWSFLKNKKQKTNTLKIEVPYDPAIPFLGMYPEKTGTLICRYMHPNVQSSAITVAKTWKQPNVHWWMKKDVALVHTHPHRTISHKIMNEIIHFWMNNAIFSKMDGLGDDYTKWSQTKTTIIWYNLYVNSNKMIQRTCLQNRNRLTDIESKHMVARGGLEGIN